MNHPVRVDVMEKHKRNDYIHLLDERLWITKEHSYRSTELTPLYIDRYKGSRNNKNMGVHTWWEFFIIFRGNGQIKGINYCCNLKQFDVCLVPPNIDHAELSDEIMDTLWIGLKGSFLDRLDNSVAHVASGKELMEYAKQLWLRSINSFEYIGPELDGITQALTGSFIKLLSTDNMHFHSNIEDTLLYINNNYMKDLNTGLLSSRIGYSESYFYRSFRKYTGKTPVDYITDIRIKNASKLLKNSSLSIKEISQITGFNDPLYFSRIFKRITGLSPKEYQ